MTDEKFIKSFEQAGGWFILCALEPILEYDKQEIQIKRKLVDAITKRYGKTLSTMDYRIKHTRKIIRANRHKDALVKIRDSAVINRMHPEANKLAKKLLAKIDEL